VDKTGCTPYVRRVSNRLPERFIAGIAAQDQAAIAACFVDDAEFRALVPPGLRERSGAAEAGQLIAAWFGDSTSLDLADMQTAEVGDRLRISYRFTGVENGEPYVVEHHLFCTVRDDRIERADLLCSGFRTPES
jgi:ketosteroid isomerase-like protein